jgi:putative FmdB family regulatory protein
VPTYDYLCEACGHAFELFQLFKDDPIVECPNCGGTVRRLIAPTPIIFRGSGWYATDSKRPTAGLSTGKTAETKADSAPTDGDKPASAPPKETGEKAGPKGSASTEA